MTITGFNNFYNKVLSTLANKIVGYKPCNLQFQCGTKWYNLNEDTEFDSLGLDDGNFEISIQAIPTKLSKL